MLFSEIFGDSGCRNRSWSRPGGVPVVLRGRICDPGGLWKLRLLPEGRPKCPKGGPKTPWGSPWARQGMLLAPFWESKWCPKVISTILWKFSPRLGGSIDFEVGGVSKWSQKSKPKRATAERWSKRRLGDNFERWQTPKRGPSTPRRARGDPRRARGDSGSGPGRGRGGVNHSPKA